MQTFGGEQGSGGGQEAGGGNTAVTTPGAGANYRDNTAPDSPLVPVSAPPRTAELSSQIHAAQQQLAELKSQAQAVISGAQQQLAQQQQQSQQERTAGQQAVQALQVQLQQETHEARQRIALVVEEARKAGAQQLQQQDLAMRAQIDGARVQAAQSMQQADLAAKAQVEQVRLSAANTIATRQRELQGASRGVEGLRTRAGSLAAGYGRETALAQTRASNPYAVQQGLTPPALA